MSMVQRRLVGLMALLLVTGGVAFAVYQQNRRHEEHAQKQQGATKLFTTTDAALIREVRLDTPTGTYVVKKQGGEGPWRIVTPREVEADGATIDALVRAALAERVTARVGGSGPDDDMTRAVAKVSDLNVFGLATPQYGLSLVNDQNVTETVAVGKRNTFDNSLYVKRGDSDDVGLVAGSFLYQVNKDLFALREKRALPITLDDIDSIAVTPERGTAYAMKRVAGKFVLTVPMQTLTDNIAAESIAGALTGLRAKTFATEVAPTEAVAKSFGLDKPMYVVQVSTVDKQVYKLRLSTARAEGATRYFVMADGGGPVFEIGSDWAHKKLSTPLNQLRDKHVVATVRDSVRNIEIKRGDQLVVLQAVPDGKDAEGAQQLRWRMGNAQGREVVQNKVDGLLFALENLKGEDIASDVTGPKERAKFGLEAPALTVTLKDDADHVLTGLRVGLSGAPGDQLVWASPPSMQPVFVVDKAAIDAISAHERDYLPGDANPPSPNNF